MTTTETPDLMSLTTIKLQSETRDRLMNMGKKSQSYDSIVNNLIDFWEEHLNIVRQWQESHPIEEMTTTRYAATASLALPREPAMAKPKVPKEPPRKKKA